MIRQEFIYEQAPFPSCHASTVAVARGGGLVAAWFGGAREGAPDVAVWLSHRSRDGWSPPVKVAAGNGVPCWNPVLFQPRTGPLLLFYKIGPSPMTWSGMVMRSEDAGRTWSMPELLPAGILGPIKNKPFELEDGTLVCGTSVESYQAWGCWVERTSDGGRTWTKHGPVNMPGHLYGTIQPAVFGTADGRLAMLCRTRGIHQAVRAESADGGRTWTPLATIDLPQNNSGLDAVRLKDGRVAAIYNHTTQGRTPLNLAVSGDMGRTWRPGPVLENQPGEYSYPAIIQAEDGTVHVTYTWKRQRIRYASLAPGDLPQA
jgi:predicted neuraminidase